MRNKVRRKIKNKLNTMHMDDYTRIKMMPRQRALRMRQNIDRDHPTKKPITSILVNRRLDRLNNKRVTNNDNDSQ